MYEIQMKTGRYVPRIHANIDRFQTFPDLCMKNCPFFLVSRIRAPFWTNKIPFFSEKMGTIMNVRFGQEVCVCVVCVRACVCVGGVSKWTGITDNSIYLQLATLKIHRLVYVMLLDPQTGLKWRGQGRKQATEALAGPPRGTFVASWRVCS